MEAFRVGATGSREAMSDHTDVFATEQRNWTDTPYEIRHLTINENILMPSLPEPFRLEGSLVEKWDRIGDSAPPLLMMAIAKHLRRVILSLER